MATSRWRKNLAAPYHSRKLKLIGRGRKHGEMAAITHVVSSTTLAPMGLTMRRTEFFSFGRLTTGFRVDGESKGCGSPTLRQRSCNYSVYRFRKIWRARR